MRTTSSTRRFRTDPVHAATIGRVLENARFAPSGGNRQGWRVVVVSDPHLRGQLRELYRRSWYDFHAPLFQRPGKEIIPNRYADQLDTVPIQLVIAADLAAITTPTLDLEQNSRLVSGAGIYPFVQNILLGLRAEGLGATLSTALVPVEAEVTKLLEIPDGFAVAAHLGVGWPLDPLPTRLNRKPVDAFATMNTFSGPPVHGCR